MSRSAPASQSLRAAGDLVVREDRRTRSERRRPRTATEGSRTGGGAGADETHRRSGDE